jgi:hypothetical protein
VLQYADEEEAETMEADEDGPATPVATHSHSPLQPSSTLQTKLIIPHSPSASASPRGRGRGSSAPSPVRSPTRVLLSRAEDYRNRAHIIAAFVALTMFWSATWDLFCSIPSEEMVAGEGDDDRDDDYYDVHVKGHTDEEFQLLFLGIAYALVALVYMFATGEIFSVLKRQDSKSEKVTPFIYFYFWLFPLCNTNIFFFFFPLDSSLLQRKNRMHPAVRKHALDNRQNAFFSYSFTTTQSERRHVRCGLGRCVDDNKFFRKYVADT